MNEQRTRRRAPLTHYLLAVAFGAIVTIALALAIGATNQSDFWAAAGITALVAAYPSASLGMRIFVTGHTVTKDPAGEQSVELAWLRRAMAGAFIDVLVAMLVAAVGFMIGGVRIDALPVLLAAIGLGAVDATARYVIIRARALA